MLLSNAPLSNVYERSLEGGLTAGAERGIRNGMNTKKRILALTTGGTIEKSYCESAGTIANRESLLRSKLMQRLRLPYTEIEVHELMAKDSLDMEEEDRERIADAINLYSSQYDGILVLHGTDTLEISLRHCHEHIDSLPIPVVFTGAMKPAGFDDSDALQNVTEALLAAQIATPGFYLSFHGRLFPAPGVTKNRECGTFEAV